jgi:hypothetical protein
MPWLARSLLRTLWLHFRRNLIETPYRWLETNLTTESSKGGHVIVLLSERATRRGTGPKRAKGARLAFKTTHDVAKFVATSEAEGFVFEGKESIK